MLAGFDRAIDRLERGVARVVGEAHALKAHVPAQRGGRHGAWQISHVGRAVQ